MTLKYFRTTLDTFYNVQAVTYTMRCAMRRCMHKHLNIEKGRRCEILLCSVCSFSSLTPCFCYSKFTFIHSIVHFSFQCNHFLSFTQSKENGMPNYSHNWIMSTHIVLEMVHELRWKNCYVYYWKKWKRLPSILLLLSVFLLSLVKSAPKCAVNCLIPIKERVWQWKMVHFTLDSCLLRSLLFCYHITM